MNRKYVVVLTIDRHQPGTDVTALYPEETLQELERFGYLEQAQAQLSEPEREANPAQARKRRKDGE